MKLDKIAFITNHGLRRWCSVFAGGGLTLRLIYSRDDVVCQEGRNILVANRYGSYHRQPIKSSGLALKLQ